jgi:hypothetical protein
VRFRGCYAADIDSPGWFRRRERWHADHLALTGAEPVCAVCGPARRRRDGDPHHRSYHRLGNDHHHDLLPLCREHHHALHELWDTCPAWRRLGRDNATVGIVAALRRNLAATAHQQWTERA